RVRPGAWTGTHWMSVIFIMSLPRANAASDGACCGWPRPDVGLGHEIVQGNRSLHDVPPSQLLGALGNFTARQDRKEVTTDVRHGESENGRPEERDVREERNVDPRGCSANPAQQRP